MSALRRACRQPALRRLMVLVLVLIASFAHGATAAFAATPSFSSQPTSPGNDTTPTWTFSVGGGKPMTCALTDPDGGTDPDVSCTGGTFTSNLTGRPQGTYSLRVTETTGGQFATSTYVLDTVAPPAPTVSGPTGPSRQMTGVFTLVDAEPGVTWVCRETAPDGTTWYPSCSQGTWTASFPSEGTYTGYISVRDAAGNPSPETVHSYTVDLTAPAAPTVTMVPGPHPPRTPSYLLSGESGGTWTCTLTDPAGGTSTTACAAGTLALDLPGSDGPWSLGVRQTDAAGNVGALTTVLYLLDTVAPALPGVSGPTGPSRDRTPTFTLSGESGASYVCTVSEPSGADNPVTCGAGSLTLDLTDPSHLDGSYTLSVHQVDASGNVGPTRNASYLLDSATTAPTVDGPSGPSGVQKPVFQLDANEAGSFLCTVTSPAGVVTTPACAAGAFELDITPGPDGSWQLSVRHVDGAGNTGAATTVTYLLDTTTPGAPGVAGPLGPHVPRRPGYAISGEPGATFTCLLTGPGVSSPLPCSDGILVLDLTGASGTYQLAVTQTDAANHESPPTTVTYLLDADPPAMPVITGPTGADPTRPVFSLIGESGGSWSCAVTDPSSSFVVVPCTAGDLQLDLTSGDGDYELSVTQADDAGNASPTATKLYALSTAPSPSPSPSDSPSPSPSPSDSPSPSPSPSPSDSPSPSPSPSPSASPLPTLGPVPPDPGPFIGPVVPDPAPFVGPVAPETPATALPTASTAPSAAAPSTVRPPASVPPRSTDSGAPNAAPADPTEPPAPNAAPSVGPERVAEPAPAPAAAPSAPATAAGPSPAAHRVTTAGPRPITRFASTTRAMDRPGIRRPASVTDSEQWRGALRLLGAAGRTGAPPILILVVAFAFLAAQDRIDRNDPKLALAPVHGHQELTFRPIDKGTP